MEGLFKSLALQHMPANMQNIDRKKAGMFPKAMWVQATILHRKCNNIQAPELIFLFFTVPRPNMDKYVFLKVLENQEQVMIDPEYVPHKCFIQSGVNGWQMSHKMHVSKLALSLTYMYKLVPHVPNMPTVWCLIINLYCIVLDLLGCCVKLAMDFSLSFAFIREDPIDLETGAQHIVRYSAIAPLLGNGSVALL